MTTLLTSHDRLSAGTSRDGFASMDRRGFLTTLAVGASALALPHDSAFASTTAPRLSVGHTGITWGYVPANAEGAARDVGSLGYEWFESFGSVLDWWDRRGGLKPHLDRAGLKLRAAYCPFELTDASKRAETVANAVKWGKLIRDGGGTIAVIGPDNVNREAFSFADARSRIISALNEIGQALADVGVIGALHPHSGSCVQTTDEVYAVMHAVNPKLVFLAPDVGELLAGGADPLPIVRDFLPVVRHAHLKDYNAGPFNEGFCPVGKGRVDMRAVIAELEKSTADVALMVELNPNSQPGGATPLETARTSKAFLQGLGYRFRS